MKADFYLPA